jgi:hypothetical protein
MPAPFGIHASARFSHPWHDVEVGIEPDEVSRRGVGDHGGTLNPPAGSLAGEALDHAVDEAADLTEEGAVVAEEDAQHLGEVGAAARPRCEDHLPVGEAKQEMFVHVLAEEQRAFLGTGRTQSVQQPDQGMEDLAAEGSGVVCFASRIGALDPREALRVVPAIQEALHGLRDALTAHLPSREANSASYRARSSGRWVRNSR